MSKIQTLMSQELKEIEFSWIELALLYHVTWKAFTDKQVGFSAFLALLF